MLTIAMLSAGSERYYVRSAFDAIDEYYVKGEERGYWVGKGSEALGLSGEVGAEDIRAVLEARSPSDGMSLVSAPAAPGRSRAGFDFTFSSPKGVSLIGLLGDPATSKEVLAAHQSAVAQALGYLERHATFVRRGHQGARSVPGEGLVGAAFVHVTSRAGDPQLHTHLLLANLAEGPDGSWSAPDSRSLYRHSRTAGFLYQAALRAELTERLGVSWRAVHRGMADPAGIGDAVLGHFSRRRAEIEAALEESGASSAEAAQVAAYRTRAPKDHSVERSVLVASWRLRADELALGQNALCSLSPGGRQPEVPPVRELAGRLLGGEGLTLHASTFNRRDVLRALAEAMPEGATVAALEAMAGYVLADQRAVALAADRHDDRWSTTELLQTERALLSSAVRARTAGRAMADATVISRALAERPGLSEEQADAVQRLVGGGEGLAALIGPAGTGKTFVLEAARSAWEASGHRVVGTALAGRTAAALAEAAGVPAFTLARLLADAERMDGVLPQGGVVLVDEASMVGTRALSKLWAASERAGAKLVLTGDYRQVPEIEAGGSFRALASALDAPELTQNRRQAETWEREALAQLRSGAPAKAVEAYVEHGRVVVAGTAPEARRALVADWWQAKQRGDDAVMFAIARSDVEALNRLARELAKKADHLLGPELEAGGRTYAVGDEVITLRPDRRLGVINGTRARVVSVEWGERSLTALTKTGHELTLTSDYLDAGHLGWGYASTLHKGQGSTVDRAFLLGGDGLYREAGYTGLSRGRSSNDLYLVKGGSFEMDSHLPAVPLRDAVEALVSGLGRSRAHELAMSSELGAAPPARGVGQPGRTTAAQVVQAEQLELLPSGTPGYLVAATGSIPAEPGARRRLERAVAAVERYRTRHGITDELDPLGPKPEGDPWRLLEHRRVARIIDQVRHGRAPDRSIGEDMGP